MRLTRLVALALPALWSASVFGSNLITNGGFLAPTVTTSNETSGCTLCAYDQTLQNIGDPNTIWSFTPNSGIVHDTSQFGNPNGLYGDTQAGFVQNTGAFSETVNLAAGDYSLVFDAALRSTDVTKQDFEIILDPGSANTILASCTNSATATCGALSSAYETVVLNPFTVTGGTHTIEFVGTKSGAGVDATAFINNVNLDALGTTAIPEPQTVLFVMPGLALMAFGLWRRRRTA